MVQHVGRSKVTQVQGLLGSIGPFNVELAALTSAQTYQMVSGESPGRPLVATCPHPDSTGPLHFKRVETPSFRAFASGYSRRTGSKDGELGPPSSF